ncbi:putative SP-containing membrane protein [Vairimorpha necatrix]|uniref:SP-containing membrane protein n=1 Tax=Vairimorpha necatrix TaxID=6039 RepID=A0AAX4JDD3_9MICR
MLILLIISIIKGTVTGFIREKKKQFLEIKTTQKFTNIKKSFLFESFKNQQVMIKDMKNNTRFIQNEDEYKEFKNKKEEKNKKNLDSDSEDEIQVFDELFVDLSVVPKVKGKLYGMKIDCTKKNGKVFTVWSRTFSYSYKQKEWVMDKVDEDDEDSVYWTYGGIAVAVMCLVFLGAYFMS